MEQSDSFSYKFHIITSVSETIRKPPLVKAQSALKNNNKIKYAEKRFSIWRIEFLHPAMWHYHDIDFARWLHPAMWHLALESWQWIHQVAAPCNVIRGSEMTCLWIHWWQHPAMWHVALGSWHWIRQVAGGCGMTCHGIRPNVRHIGILHLVSILTISPQSTSAAVCEILSKLDHPQQKKMTSCRFSRWRISAILNFRGPIMGSLKSSIT